MRFCVCDTLVNSVFRVGIDAAHMPHLFIPPQRGSPTAHWKMQSNLHTAKRCLINGVKCAGGQAAGGVKPGNTPLDRCLSATGRQSKDLLSLGTTKLHLLVVRRRKLWNGLDLPVTHGYCSRLNPLLTDLLACISALNTSLRVDLK